MIVGWRERAGHAGGQAGDAEVVGRRLAAGVLQARADTSSAPVAGPTWLFVTNDSVKLCAASSERVVPTDPEVVAQRGNGGLHGGGGGGLGQRGTIGS